MIPSDIVYWLALQEKRRLLSASRVEQVFNQFHSLEQLWKADNNYLSDLGLDERSIINFMRYRNSVRFENYKQLLKILERGKVRVLRYVDKDFPITLKDLGKALEGPPLILFHQGSFTNFNECVGIVGTRNPSHYGHVMARRLGRAVAKKGYTVVSGLARGVDTEAHCGALEVPRGRTIAILAWLNPIYPLENAELSKDVIARGALLSENYFRPGTRLGKLNRAEFVARNRITSGLSRCTIAVESGKEGGTVHQVRIALSQGRKVFAVKPKSSNKRAKEGYELFVEMGATPIKSARPVLNFLKKSSSETAFGEKRIDSFSQDSVLVLDKGG